MIPIENEKRIDWNAIRAEYIGGGISQRKLAAKYGVSPDGLMQKANREGWKRDRDKAVSKGIAESQQKSADAIADNAVIAADLKKRLLLRLMIDQVYEVVVFRLQFFLLLLFDQRVFLFCYHSAGNIVGAFYKFRNALVNIFGPLIIVVFVVFVLILFYILFVIFIFFVSNNSNIFFIFIISIVNKLFNILLLTFKIK